MWFMRRVNGDSMLPSYRHGQLVIGSHMRNFSVGDVVIAFMNGREVLKRIKRINNGQIYLVGDNEEHSTDSRTYGWVNDTDILGKVIWPSR